MRNHRSFTETLRIRRRYPHSYAISKLRAGVSAGLGGFVGFRQLARGIPGEKRYPEGEPTSRERTELLR